MSGKSTATGQEPQASGDEPRTVASVSLPAASCSGLPMPVRLAHPFGMGTKSRESMFGPSIRASAERAAAARKEADRLACDAWNKRTLGYRGPAQPSPTLGASARLATGVGAANQNF